MAKHWKRILSFILALALTVTGITFSGPIIVRAADSAEMTTEDIDDPVEETVNAEVWFVQSATGKIITLDGVENNPIDCKLVYNKNDIPKNGLFTIYYGEYNGKEVVNFTNTQTDTSWKADGDNIYQIKKRTNPSGWESVTIEPQGDGTIAFRGNANDKYFTVQNDQLALTTLNDGESPSSNEKFILYTTAAPKTAKKVTLTDVSGDQVSLSWEGVSECLYSGYEVLYATSEDGEYKSAGTTKDTSFTVTGLEISTKYYFKVRTITNNAGGPYADSKIAYATTLKEYKPAKPDNVKLEEKNGKLVLTWDASRGKTGYRIYRAESRFAEYKEIATTTSETYTDAKPNSSKYSNYYKVQAYNSQDASELSEPTSLELEMFGSNMYVFNETDDPEKIHEVTESIFQKQHYNQFGSSRYALAYKPGDYTDTGILNMGYYTQTIGLGKTPYDVSLYNAHTPAALSGNNATCNFWVGIENLSIVDKEGYNDPYYWFQWGVSQAAPARRLNVERKSHFQWYWDGWCSGGFIADSNFQKPAGSYSQQQYYYRNCNLAEGVYGVNWNHMLQGCTGATAQNSSDNSGKPWSEFVRLTNDNGSTNWNQRGCTTTLDVTDKVREKPFLFFDTESDKYKVFVPALRENETGLSWSHGDMGKGTVIDVEKNFYIAKPDVDTADTINYQLAIGKNIIFSPGVYRVDKPIQVNEPNTILLGLGIATIIPDNKEAAIQTADVGGISIAGLILDAGNYSETLLTVGKEGCNKDHSDNPTVLHDVIYRVGGTGELGRVKSCQVLNSNDVIIDHTWIWRADHGDYVGWSQNTSDNGLIVNGDRVTAYGLFVEHFQKYDVIWRGEKGKTYFVQNEKCYDPQDQAEWMSHNGKKLGYAAYKVANNVSEHYAVGVGVYDVFINTNGASIYLDNAIEVPDKPNVLVENATTVEIAGADGPKVGINHIVNDTAAGIRTGAGNNGGFAVQKLLSYCNGNSISLPDYYTSEQSVQKVVEEGVAPKNDSEAEKNITKETPSKDSEKPIWEMTDDDYQKKQDECLDKWENGGSSGNKPSTPSGNQPSAPSGNTPVTPGTKPAATGSGTLKAGTLIRAGKYTYRVISAGKKTGKVRLTGVVKKYRKSLKKVNIPAVIKAKGRKLSVTTVGAKAFAKCKKIQRVTFGKNVTTIRTKAFANNKKIKRIIFKGKKLKKMAKNTFYKKVRKTVKVTARNKKLKKKVLKSLGRKR